MKPKTLSLIARMLMYGGIGATMAKGGISIMEQPFNFFLILVMLVIVSLINYADGMRDCREIYNRILNDDED